ncbi:caprin-2 isoform X2 [Scleropages formosus]|uniref:caprin-2 isoform X2 n=1 Tax=Scleropages formosus TaxID=113540 RepID=UPI0008788294|nr:caprin-2 isoform X2 [Scleropages formosus]
MVHLSSSPNLDASPPPEPSDGAKGKPGSPRADSPSALSSLQLALAASASTVYQGYDTYIEDGLICLKHKIRNLEKKKLKLEDYRKRLKNGETLNKDQLDAVEKYDEVFHNLKFAKELQKTISGLSQDLVKAQRKATRREQVARMEAEKRRLRTVLQIHHILQSLQQEHVRKDFRSGLNQAPFLPARELERLLDLAGLLGIHRDESMSLQDQMEQVSVSYWDLLEGRDKPVAGTTFKHMKEQLAKLMDCGYFDHIPAPRREKLEESEAVVPKEAETSKPQRIVSDLSTLAASPVSTREFLNRHYLPDTDFSGQGQSNSNQALKENWKAEFLALKQREPPDSWEMEFTEASAPLEPVPEKPWRGPVGFDPTEQMPIKTAASDVKQQRVRKSKVEQPKKPARKADEPIEVFSSPCSLPDDPIQRKQQLRNLMDQIQGSFSFMQESVLDREGSPVIRHARMSPPAAESSSPSDSENDVKNQADVPKALHSTPLPPRCLSVNGKASLSNGDQTLCDTDLDHTADKVDHETIELSETEEFSSPLFRRESTISVSLAENTSEQTLVSQADEQPCNASAPSVPHQPQSFPSPPCSHSLNITGSAPFQTMHTVFKINAPLPPRSDSDQKSDTSAFSDSYNLSYATASTQTPPDLDFQDLDSLQPVTTYQSECPVTNSCQVYLSPGQPGGVLPRPSQPYYTRGSVRGMARGGRGLAHSFRSPGGYRGGYEAYRTGLRSPGGSYIPQAHGTRDFPPVLYGVRETGYQMPYKRGTGSQRSGSRAAWSNSSQVSSPERDDETFISADSGHGDSRCATPIDIPVAAQGPALMPVHIYPLPQPMRVAFSAARTSNFAPGSLDQTIIFDLLHSNLGETFDVHLGRFSCPVNGTYVFIFHILKLAVNVPLYVNLMRNEEVMVSAYANDGAPDHETASNHAVLQLYQGDQVWLRLHRGAIYGSSWKYSTFSGYLLYQD